MVANFLIGKVVGVQRGLMRDEDQYCHWRCCLESQILLLSTDWQIRKSKGRVDKVVTSEVLVGGDFNGHAGKDMGGFEEVHGGFEIKQINNGGIGQLVKG